MSQPLEALRQHLFTAVLSDCLDAAGYRDQAMHARIRPLDSKGRGKVAGENATREALARGEKLADVFKRHGIL
jgi:hypothetical protein